MNGRAREAAVAAAGGGAVPAVVVTPGGSRGRGLCGPCPRGAEASGSPEAAGSLRWGSGGGSRPRWGRPGGLGVVSGPSLGLAEAHAPEGRCWRGHF